MSTSTRQPESSNFSLMMLKRIKRIGLKKCKIILSFVVTTWYHMRFSQQKVGLESLLNIEWVKRGSSQRASNKKLKRVMNSKEISLLQKNWARWRKSTIKIRSKCASSKTCLFQVYLKIPMFRVDLKVLRCRLLILGIKTSRWIQCGMIVFTITCPTMHPLKLQDFKPLKTVLQGQWLPHNNRTGGHVYKEASCKTGKRS